MSASKRRVVGPSESEAAAISRLVLPGPGAQGGVESRVDIPAFTCVAICYGRVFTDKEHEQVFQGNDPYAQWTVESKTRRPSSTNSRSVRSYLVHKRVVTPSWMPGGVIDPLFENRGLAPFFKEAPGVAEPECVYVINFPKGRMEYWVGRHGAKAGKPLRLCYNPDACAFPTVYVLYGALARPRSVNELATTAMGRRLLSSRFGWTNQATIEGWRRQYSWTKERASISNTNFNNFTSPKWNSLLKDKYNHHLFMQVANYSRQDHRDRVPLYNYRQKLKHNVAVRRFREMCVSSLDRLTDLEAVDMAGHVYYSVYGRYTFQDHMGMRNHANMSDKTLVLLWIAYNLDLGGDDRRLALKLLEKTRGTAFPLDSVAADPGRWAPRLARVALKEACDRQR